MSSSYTRLRKVFIILTPSLCCRESISVCSVCDKIIGNIKISFSEPPVIYHPECLKVCSVFFLACFILNIGGYTVHWMTKALVLIMLILCVCLLQCGVCDKALGDMLTPMFLHNQVIQCDGCFAKTHKTSSLTGTNMSSETTQSILWLMCCLDWEVHHCCLNSVFCVLNQFLYVFFRT